MLEAGGWWPVGASAIPRFVVAVTGALIVSVKPDHLAALGRLVMSWYGGHYMREFQDFLSARVNQAALSCPYAFFECLAVVFGNERPITKLAFAQEVYDPTEVTEQARPQPDTCKLFSKVGRRGLSAVM